jgi:hypothetical protein
MPGRDVYLDGLLGQHEPFAIFVTGAIAGKFFEIVCLCQQVGRHPSQALGQTPVIALLCQTSAYPCLTPKIHCEEHGRSP